MTPRNWDEYLDAAARIPRAVKTIWGMINSRVAQQEREMQAVANINHYELQELFATAKEMQLGEPGREEMVGRVDAILNACPQDGGECHECARIICPHGDSMHFHHDGCPSCIDT